MDETIKTSQVADRLGVPKPTMTVWIRMLGWEPPKDSTGSWRFTPEQIAQLEQVRDWLRVDGRSMETVRRRLTPADSPSPLSAAPLDFTPVIRALEDLAERAEPPRAAEVAEAVAAQLAPALAEATSANRRAADAQAGLIEAQRGLVDATRQLTELGERYALATHHIGRLEGERAALAQQLTEARGLLAAPPPPPTLWQRLFGRR